MANNGDQDDVEIIFPPDLLERNQRNQRESQRERMHLIDIYNMSEVATVADIGEYVDTNPNGNCGWEVLVIILFFAGYYDVSSFVTALILQPGERRRPLTKTERRTIFPNIRQHLRRQINNERRTLKNHYIQHYQVFRGDPQDPDPEVVTTAGDSLYEFKGNFRQLRQRVANAIHHDDVDYDDENIFVNFNQWMRGHFWAIASHYYHLSFVVYHENNAVAERRTNIFRWRYDTNQVMVYEYPREYMTPPFVNRFHCVSFDTNHYQYVKRLYPPVRRGLNSLIKKVHYLAGLPTVGPFQLPQARAHADFETARQDIAINPNALLDTVAAGAICLVRAL